MRHLADPTGGPSALLSVPAIFAKRSRAPLVIRQAPPSAPIPLTNGASTRADGLIRRLRNARVGSSFWGARPALPKGCTVLKSGSGDATTFRPTAGGPIVPTAPGELDPWHLLDHAAQVIAPPDDALATLAILTGIPAIDAVTGEPLAQEPDARSALAWRVLVDGLTYREPFTGAAIAPEDAIDLLGDWRRHLETTAGIGVQFGIRGWKRPQIDRFLTTASGPPRHARSAKAALAAARKTGAAVAIWPSRVPPEFETQAAARNVALARIEDGFLRSVGLGVHLVPPQSITLDRQGVHYDPARPSDLESLLAHHPFSPELVERAAALRARIVSAGLGKYGCVGTASPIALPSGRRSVLVIGQVEDDRSVLAGDLTRAGNAGLLARARAIAPDAFLLYKPHPDVLSGHRRGGLGKDADRLADHVIDAPCGLAPLLEQVDEVHALTSLAGFEALLRGRTVVCHGAPFYAGWGLTHDLVAVPRRERRLTVDQLVAGALVLYPLYLDPGTGLPCPVERLVTCLAGAGPRPSLVNRLRHLEGAVRGALRQAAA